MEYLYIFLGVLFVAIVVLIWKKRQKPTETSIPLNSEDNQVIQSSAAHELVKQEHSATVLPVVLEDVSNKEEITVGADMAQLLKHVVQSVGIPAAIQSLGKKPTYELVFAPEVEAALKSGVYSLRKSKEDGYWRAIVVDGKNTIKAQANLKKVNPLQVRRIALDLATTVVAQEHLREIKQSLDKIETIVNKLVTMKLNEYHGQARSSFNYLDRVYVFLKTDTVDSKVTHQLENNYKADIDTIYALLKHIDSPLGKMNELKKRAFVFKEADKIQTMKEVIGEFQEYEELIYMFLLSLQGEIHAMRLLGDPEAAIDQATKQVNTISQEFESKRHAFHQGLESYEKEFKVRFALASRERNQIQLIANEHMAVIDQSAARAINLDFKAEVEPRKLFIVSEGDEVKVFANR
ncbi:hypothetical protein EVJ29_00420 [Exiguobacterium sp. SH4S7]|uniref:hypothetical protein n=1 Tax=Exiguobacterium sp. SH4S7 TaxID=2510958 RepID=UPI00103C3292|nr:hypothetical protein [Exiguobacterium sp. SH4S7]TCI39137.1 hypothetical protein EVJ29_00420 [Exiguobacterium sp. SH4S7]